MMNNEYKRIMDGPAVGATPSGMGLSAYCLQSDGDMRAAIQRLRLALMRLRSAESLIELSSNEGIVEDYELEMLEEAMDKMLKQWFLDHIDEHADVDEIAHYIRWFSGDGDWQWWNVDNVNEHDAILHLEVYGFPVSGLDALRWLCKCCGISSMEEISNDE